MTLKRIYKKFFSRQARKGKILRIKRGDIRRNRPKSKPKGVKKAMSQLPKLSFRQTLLSILTVLIVVIGFIIVIYQVILTGLYNYSKFQNINFNSQKVESNRIRAQDWEGKAKLSMLILGVDYRQSGHKQIDSLVLLQIHPESEQISWLFIPIETYIDTPEFGLVPIKNLIVLGDLEKEDYGFTYAVDNIEQAMFVQTDRYFIYNTSILGQIIDTLGKIAVRVPTKYSVKDQSNRYKVSFFDENRVTLTSDTVLDFMKDVSGGEKSRLERQLLFYEGLIRSFYIVDIWKLSEVADLLKKGVYSNLTGMEFFNVFTFVWHNRGELNMAVLDPSDLAETIHPDGETVHVFKGIELYEIIRKRALNQHIIDELARVEIFNGSSYLRAAATYATIFKNEGIDVIRKNNAPCEYKKTIIYIQDESRSYSKTIETLERILGDVEVVYSKTGFLSTGDIVVVLGQDIKEKANGLLDGKGL